MKAKRITNNRILTTLGLLIIAVSLGYGQGLLAEGAIKLIKMTRNTEEIKQPQFIHVDYTADKEDSFKLKSMIREAFAEEAESVRRADSRIIREFHVSSVSVSYEAEMETEEWMTMPFENKAEANLSTESWMTQSFSESVEAAIPVESWMTESFTNSVETELDVESWMTESFTESVETELATEEWMMQPISESMENEIVVEEWMTVSFTEAGEESLEVENWMTQSLNSK